MSVTQKLEDMHGEFRELRGKVDAVLEAHENRLNALNLKVNENKTTHDQEHKDSSKDSRDIIGRIIAAGSLIVAVAALFIKANG